VNANDDGMRRGNVGRDMKEGEGIKDDEREVCVWRK